jgi:hypothetical protein
VRLAGRELVQAGLVLPERERPQRLPGRAIDRERTAYGVAAWSIVHGLATLRLNGNLPAQLGDDPEEITRVVAAHLRPPRPALAGGQPG